MSASFPLIRQAISRALLATASLAAGLAAAQEPGEEIAEVVVTGSSIRGVEAPVGSNLMAVGRDVIEKTAAQTTQQILRTIPAITGMGANPQGQNPSSYFMPTIHSLGASSSNSTLVLIDGHRFSPGGQQQTLVDAGIVPPIAIERVEVLAEGASSVYGSDAVAGVVNFITRRSYDGIRMTAQVGHGDDYDTQSFGFLGGTNWDTGSAMFAMNYSDRDPLARAARPELHPDHRSKGGTNFLSFNCSPATIQPGGSGPIYLSATSSTAVANNSDNAPCDPNVHGDVFGGERRANMMARFTQDIGERLTIGLDGLYSDRDFKTRVPRGTLTATAFRTGDQANPFYVNPPGVVEGTTAGDRQTIRFSADELLGPGAVSFNDAVNYFFAANAEYRLNDRFRLTGLAVYGREDSFVGDQGQLNQSAALLALNGTTNGAGNPTTPSVPSTGQIVLNYPLTPETALDVWNPPETNRTSRAVLERLVDNRTESRWYYSLQQIRVGLDGELFEIPGGPVRIAVGGEYAGYDLDINRVRPNNTGPASTGSEFFELYLKRHVNSAYAEVLVPIVGPDNEKRFIRSLDLNVSGRYDDYSDTGSTSNPRFGVNWEVFRGLRFRGSFSRSFVAPQLTSYGDRSRGGLTSFSGYSATSGTIRVPIASFPLAAQLPGCTDPGLEVCTITSATPGISINGAPADPKPGRGESWTFGFDLAPDALPGFRLSATLFNTKLINQITGVNVSNAINSEALHSNLQIFPNGATPEDIKAAAGDFPQNTPLPPTVYYILSVRQQNVLNLDIQGIDAEVAYRFETERAGAFTIGGSMSRFHKFDQHIAGGPKFSVLDTTGFNNTFPSIALQARMHLGWQYRGLEATLWATHIGDYRNWSGTSVNPVETVNGNPVGGGDKVDSNTMFDLNLSYTLQGGRFAGSQIYADISNLFDEDPPFYNTANGYDQYSGNILGRVVSVGVRVDF